ncbi:MAG: ABC transporter substrate-binding protein [Alphaproteobacteria bacterium]|nr:ABC transporter substrate-binding protein [Alphaproteobacteria bacterium]
MTPAIADVVKELTPTGKIRVSINLGNVVLAKQDPTTKELSGVSVDLARELGRRLGAPIELTPFPAAGRVFEAVKAGTLDLMFLAIEPVRAQEISFTPPYVLIEGTYLVLKDSPFKSVEELDRPGHRIAVNTGSAYDLFLTRTLKQATILRGPDGIAMLLKDKLEAAAGVKQALVIHARTDASVRVMAGRFQVIEQAMGTPAGRPAAARYLRGFIEEMKASGFVAEALKRHNQPDATIAPPAAG